MQASAKAKTGKSAGQPEAVAANQAGADSAAALTSLHTLLLRIAVVVGGASVMVVEILGSRVLAPSFGTTLHVWSALITVTLAALAIGYAVGGRVADRRPGLGTLMMVMAIAAGALLLSDLITKPVLRIAYGAGMVGGTFLAATLLFLPTLFLLGMVSPMAVRAAANQLHLGKSVGNLYALSTIGSVAGSLSVSLLLIPNLSVHAAIISTAVALTVPPLLYLVASAKKQAAVLLLVGLVLGGVTTKVLGDEADREVMYKNEAYPVTARVPSSYGELVVSDHRGVRYLFLNGVQQGSLIGDVSYARYAYGLERLATVKGVPKSVLIWGLGAGVYARAMAEAGSQVTVIEIDPMSEKVAREYFGLPASVKVIIGDARTETSKLTEKYDVIVLDAFSGDSPPFHLLTQEAFADLKEKLAPNGLVVANIVGGVSGSEARVVSSVAATLESVFGKTQVFSPNWLLAGKKANFVSTMFIVCGELPETPAPFTLKLAEDVRRMNYIDSVLASRLELPREQAVILTDNFAPLEAWSDAAVQAMRY
ncbi:MAG: fused MFS/spermidine synthase [Acidobacteria bacterium]|nr:fused MFS/spermidine synthase [Acidobacteriota bacterium]